MERRITMNLITLWNAFVLLVIGAIGIEIAITIFVLLLNFNSSDEKRG